MTDDYFVLEARRSDAEAKLRGAIRKRKAWTTKARRAKTYLARYHGQEIDARQDLIALGVDPDAIVADELNGYDAALPSDIDV